MQAKLSPMHPAAASTEGEVGEAVPACLVFGGVALGTEGFGLVPELGRALDDVLAEGEVCSSRT